MEIQNRVRLIRIAICLGLLVGILFTFELWFIVWVWNAAMILIVPILFWRSSDSPSEAFCRLSDDESSIELIVKEKPAILDGSFKITRISCRR